jgi:hypothetical protein
MHANIGKTDKVIHFILGGIIIVAGIIFKSCIGMAGLIPIIFTLAGFRLLPWKRK